MEKERLSRALQFLIDQHHSNIVTLIMDRNKQVSKFLCNKYPEIEHQYDIFQKVRWSSKLYYFSLTLKK